MCLIAGCQKQRETPKLAVLIVVDMLPGDYMARFGQHFGNDGFRRLIRQGTECTDAHFSHGNTQTGPGHATIATGAHPAEHGIVGNRWFEPGKSAIYCVDDTEYMTIGHKDWYDSEGYSPGKLLAPTLGDSLKKTYGQSAKVWSVSLKPRSAVLMAGQSGDGAIWFTTKSGDFVTSSFYKKEAPDWIKQINEERLADAYLGKTWSLSLPAAEYESYGPDDASYEKGITVIWLNYFPHVLGQNMPIVSKLFWEQFQVSPFGDEVVFEIARRAIANESLGQDDVPDLLTIAPSSVDYCGHMFGPNSHEMADIIIRLDRQVASMLRYLDEHVGAEHYVAVLTSDHGVASAPEWAQKHGLGGGRIDAGKMFNNIHQALVEKFGSTADGLHYVTAIDLPWIYLNTPVIEFHGGSIAEAEKIAADRLRQEESVEEAVVVSSLQGKTTLTPLEQGVKNGAFEGRSGQIFLQPKPYWYRDTACAGHGSFHKFDTHVPLVFSGPGFRKQRISERVDVRDLSVTLAEVLRTGKPAKASGQVIKKAIVE